MKKTNSWRYPFILKIMKIKMTILDKFNYCRSPDTSPWRVCWIFGGWQHLQCHCLADQRQECQWNSLVPWVSWMKPKSGRSTAGHLTCWLSQLSEVCACLGLLFAALCFALGLFSAAAGFLTPWCPDQLYQSICAIHRVTSWEMTTQCKCHVVLPSVCCCLSGDSSILRRTKTPRLGQ